MARMAAMKPDEDRPAPEQSERSKSGADERRRRQAEALRANLLRRKQQDRARADTPPTDDSDP